MVTVFDFGDGTAAFIFTIVIVVILVLRVVNVTLHDIVISVSNDVVFDRITISLVAVRISFLMLVVVIVMVMMVVMVVMVVMIMIRIIRIIV